MSAHWNDKSRGEQIVDFLIGFAVLVALGCIPIIFVLLVIGLGMRIL